MSNMLYLTGKYANLLKRATVTVNPAALAAYPVANLSDDDPSTPMIYGSNGANSWVNVVLTGLTNGNFESALTTGWVDTSVPGGSATRVNTAGHVNSGTWGCDLVSASVSSYGEVRQLVSVSAGEYRQLGVFAKTISGTPSLNFVIVNQMTGRYWTGSTWTSTPTGVAPTGTLSGAFSFFYVNYRVEDYDTCMADETAVYVYIRNSGAAASTVAIDDAQDVPGVNFAGVIGHNIVPSSAACVVRYDPSGAYSGGETVASTMTIARGLFYSTFTMAYTSPWRVSVDGTNWTTPVIGELVLGQYQSTSKPQWDLSVEYDMPGIVNTYQGRTSTYNFTKDPIESLVMTTRSPTEALAKEIIQSLWLRSGRGRYPSIIIPSDAETRMYYGHLEGPVTETRPPGRYVTSLRLRGSALPNSNL